MRRIVSGAWHRLCLTVAATLAIALVAGCGGGADGKEQTKRQKDREKQEIATPEQPPQGELTPEVAKKPNVVLVMSDDQSRATFNRKVMPRAFEELADGGTQFPNATVSSNLCCPARAGLITGTYPHSTRILSNSPGYPRLSQPNSTLATWLLTAGYRTALFGKLMNGYESTDPAPGFSDWYGAIGSPKYFDYELSENGDIAKFGSKPRDYLDRVLTDKADGFIRDAAGTDARPFFMWVSLYAPHYEKSDEKRCGGGDLPQPDPRDLGLFRDGKLPPNDAFNEKDISDKRQRIQANPRLGPKEIKQARISYGCGRAAMRGVDRSIGQLIDTLRETNELENTIFVFLADNGTFNGEHRIAKGKGDPYESGVNIPMLARIPAGVLGGEPVSVVDDPVANVDFAPTVLDLAGVEPCAQEDCRVIDGTSFAPVMRGESTAKTHDRGILLQLGPQCKGYDGIRTSRYSYVVYRLETFVKKDPCLVESRELYDHKKDPFELDNLLADPASQRRYQDVYRDLDSRLSKLKECSGTSGRHGCE